MKKNISQVLPKGDKDIIKDALIQYERTLSCLIDKFEREGNESMVAQLHHNRHDLYSLIAYTEYDMVVNLPQEVKDNFVHKHGVDFPLYIYEVLKYPVEQESKWVTVIVGDFSFNDDNLHERSAYVNSIISIQKHLRSQVGDYIDDIESEGYGYIVIEDYDGRIEFDVNEVEEVDERVYQVVWLGGHYMGESKLVPFSYFEDDKNGFKDEMSYVNQLGIGARRFIDGIIIVRIK